MKIILQIQLLAISAICIHNVIAGDKSGGCSSGIAGSYGGKNYCCADSCGECGGYGCHLRDGGEMSCCCQRIEENSGICGPDVPPPCRLVITETMEPTTGQPMTTPPIMTMPPTELTFPPTMPTAKPTIVVPVTPMPTAKPTTVGTQKPITLKPLPVTPKPTQMPAKPTAKPTQPATPIIPQTLTTPPVVRAHPTTPPVVTAKPTAKPTMMTPIPTAKPTLSITGKPTAKPTLPTAKPTTPVATAKPTQMPVTVLPTLPKPTVPVVTAKPTAKPTIAPTQPPTQKPTVRVTPAPCDCENEATCYAPTSTCLCPAGFGGVKCEIAPRTCLAGEKPCGYTSVNKVFTASVICCTATQRCLPSITTTGITTECTN